MMATPYGRHGPVIVQGHPVEHATYNASPYNHVSDVAKQQQQPAPQDISQPQQQLQPSRAEGAGACRDVIWGVLFYVHLTIMAFLAIYYAPQVVGSAVSNYGGDGRLLLSATTASRTFFGRYLQDENEQGGGDQNEGEDIDIDIGALLSVTAIAGVLACIFSSLAMGFMIKFAEGLIKVALWFNIIVFALMALASLLVGALEGALAGGLMCAISAYYAYCVWSRIPFAASNLVTAVTAVRANIGLALYAYISLILLFGWSIWWTISALSTILVLADCDADGECANDINAGLLFLFFISYYWTIQVITNVVHVTTAGTVGTWWHVPVEANGCCSKAVRDSYVRSLTTSFGSICLGSLIVAIIQALKEVVHNMRENGDSLVACCAECLIGCIESLVEYFNKWAFVYVGLYGFSFMEAGTNVMTLFRNRGWTSIITDLMVDTVLFMVSMGVGVLTAIVALLIGSAMNIGDAATLGSAAILGFFIGYGMSATLFSVVSSAVNTVVVCYAEAPNEFQANHPELSVRMRDSWRQAWPNDFGY